MPLIFFILLVLLIAQIGFWQTLAAIVGAAIMFIVLIPLLIVVSVMGTLLLLASFSR